MTLVNNYWTLLSFVLVMVSMPHWPVLPSSWWLIPLSVCLLACRHYKVFPYFLGITFGLMVAIMHGNLLSWQRHTLDQSGDNITITATIDSIFTSSRYGYVGLATISQIENRPLPFWQQATVRLTLPIKPALNATVHARVHLAPITGYFNQAGFDSERFYLSQHVVARANLDSSQSYYLLDQSNVRNRILDRVTQATQDLAHYGLIRALAFGERDAIPDSQWLGLRNSGLSHLVAISGLHIGVAFALGYWLGFAVLRLLPGQLWLPLLLGSGLALVYAWLAGFTLPTQRALMICWLNAILLLLQWRITPLNRILLVGSVSLALDAFVTCSVSFWLSFSAYAVVVYAVSQPRFIHLHPILKPLYLQAILLVLMTPVLAKSFQGISLSAAGYNLLWVPWFSVVIVPLLFVALFFSSLTIPFSGQLWQWLDMTFWPVSWSLHFADTSWWPVTSQQWWLIASAAVMAILFPWLSRQGKWLVSACLMSVIVERWAEPPPEQWRVDILDVGHGLAVLIEQQGEVVLYDTGASWESGSVVSSVVSPVMLDKNIQQVEGLIISHLDNDHAGGREDFIERWNPSWQRASQSLSGYQACDWSQQWQWKQLTFQVLWPPSVVSQARNPHSCVVLVTDGQFRLLLTGDIPKLAEYLILQQPEAVASDVIVVPHHGSSTSSSQALVEAVKARLAIASLAKFNHWNLPAASVRRRYHQYGEWWDTGSKGQVSLVISPTGWRHQSWRDTHGSAWYRQMLRNRVE
ncbi:DNA internalization-related competence protein ComEC/Rec2 [Vibrio sp.]|uniref:DNA internalization-related competence protein ComEC/Rec2 n=1 Tax=Vibrio sp. TaxID=678 RepID=UPI003D1349F8